MKKKIGKIVALFMAAGLLVNSFFWSAANEGDNGALDAVQEIQENKETLHSHEWGNETVNTPATCNTDGSATVTCSSCGATEDRTISATGEHNFGDWTLVTAATADTPVKKNVSVMTAVQKRQGKSRCRIIQITSWKIS